MAVDLQCVFPQEIIQLNSVNEVPGMSPRTLNILGPDFQSIDEVKINDVASPSVVVISKRRLLAQVPDSQVLAHISSVSVTSNRLMTSGQSFLRFRIGRTASKVSGVLRLLQSFLKILLTTPGRDIFAPRIGAGVLRSVGSSFSADEGGAIVSGVIISVSTAQRQMLAIQSRDSTLPLNERLLSARVLTAGYDATQGALAVSIEVTSQAGQAQSANLLI